MAISRNQGLYGYPTYNQAEKIISKFGGEARMAKLIGVTRISIYRWQYRRPYGSDGLIPTPQIDRIKEVARLEGILLRKEDWEPETFKYDDDILAQREQKLAEAAQKNFRIKLPELAL